MLYHYDIPSTNFHNFRCKLGKSLGLDSTYQSPPILELNKKVIGVEQEFNI